MIDVDFFYEMTSSFLTFFNFFLREKHYIFVTVIRNQKNKFMKTKITTLLLCVALSMPMKAQLKSDTFFYEPIFSSKINTTPTDYGTYYAIEFENMEIEPMPESVPIKSGMLLLTIFSSMYVMFKRKENIK